MKGSENEAASLKATEATIENLGRWECRHGIGHPVIRKVINGFKQNLIIPVCSICKEWYSGELFAFAPT